MNRRQREQLDVLTSAYEFCTQSPMPPSLLLAALTSGLTMNMIQRCTASNTLTVGTRPHEQGDSAGTVTEK